ncbi:MAG: hypothetical protein HY828_12565 [Actinobacteria bacterium]|nr:hypothetical protein [Actinomycetota bacterium]
MTDRRVRSAWFLMPFALLAVACGGDDGGTEQLATTLPPTECVAGEFDAGRTVVITVDDVVGGFGGLGSRTPSDLAAGMVRVSVEADAENREPVSVAVTRDGVEVATVRGVAAGSVCAIDIELAAGHYVVVEGDRDVEFDVVAP